MLLVSYVSDVMMFAPNDMFNDETTFDREYLKTQSRWEKLLEIGQSIDDGEIRFLGSPAN
ncbi:MAG: hypothetical protein ABJQ70_20870 [Roseobacter sp.]